MANFEFKTDNSPLHENEDIVSARGTFSDCPIGWGQLIRQLFIDIRAVCEKYNSALPRVTQVKSKFGMLCFYLDEKSIVEGSNTASEIRQLICEAEKRSQSTCEITGLPGSYYVKDRWYATLNEDKAIQLGYTKVPNPENSID